MSIIRKTTTALVTSAIVWTGTGFANADTATQPAASPAISTAVAFDEVTDIAFKKKSRWKKSDVHLDVVINGVDDEFWRDEILRPTHREMDFQLRRKSREEDAHIRPVRWGGECRVEVEATARLMNRDGDVEVHGVVKLYEGTSTNSRDLDGVRDFVFTVPADEETQVKTIHVRNDDEGGDWADVRITAYNNSY